MIGNGREIRGGKRSGEKSRINEKEEEGGKERKGQERKGREGKGSKEGMKTKRKNWKRYEKEEEEKNK